MLLANPAQSPAAFARERTCARMMRKSTVAMCLLAALCTVLITIGAVNTVNSSTNTTNTNTADTTNTNTNQFVRERALAVPDTGSEVKKMDVEEDVQQDNVEEHSYDDQGELDTPNKDEDEDEDEEQEKLNNIIMNGVILAIVVLILLPCLCFLSSPFSRVWWRRFRISIIEMGLLHGGDQVDITSEAYLEEWGRRQEKKREKGEKEQEGKEQEKKKQERKKQEEEHKEREQEEKEQDKKEQEEKENKQEIAEQVNTVTFIKEKMVVMANSEQKCV